MKWSLQQLQKISVFPYHFQCTFDYHNRIANSEDFYDVSLVDVSGTINRIDLDTYQFTYHVSGKLILPCSLTLEPVDYELNDDFDEIYSTKKDDDFYLIEKNTIDLEKIIWSNIVLSIPLRVVRDDAYEILKSRGITFEDTQNDNL